MTWQKCTISQPHGLSTKLWLHIYKGEFLLRKVVSYMCEHNQLSLVSQAHISAPIPQSPISHWDPMSEETSRTYQWKEKSPKNWSTSTLLRRLSMLKSKRGLTAASFIDKNCTATYSSPTVEELCPISEQCGQQVYLNDLLQSECEESRITKEAMKKAPRFGAVVIARNW